MQAVAMCSSFFLACLEKGQSPLGVRGGLVFPLLSWPLVHVCFLTSTPWLCYAVLIPRTQNKDICPRKVLLLVLRLLQGCLYRCVAAECEVGQKILDMDLFRYPCSPRAAQPSQDKCVTVRSQQSLIVRASHEASWNKPAQHLLPAFSGMVLRQVNT